MELLTEIFHLSLRIGLQMRRFLWPRDLNHGLDLSQALNMQHVILDLLALVNETV